MSDLKNILQKITNTLNLSKIWNHITNFKKDLSNIFSQPAKIWSHIKTNVSRTTNYQTDVPGTEQPKSTPDKSQKGIGECTIFQW